MLNERVFTFRGGVLFYIYSIILIILLGVSNAYVVTEDFLNVSFHSQLSNEQIENIINVNKRYQWISYLIIPIILLLKWMILASVIYVGLFLLNKNVTYKNCFKIVQLAELVMILAATAKLAWFIVYPPKTIEDVQYFYPLALTQLFSPNQIPKYLIYPLQQLNVFEVLYWLLIAGGIKAFTQKTFAQSLKITALSYGVAMFVWCLVIVFIQLQFS